MEMELLIKDKSLKLLIWLLYGNYPLFSFVKTITMLWVPVLRDLPKVVTIMLEIQLFQESKSMVKIYLL